MFVTGASPGRRIPAFRPMTRRSATRYRTRSCRCCIVSILAPPEGGAQLCTRQVVASFNFFRIQTRTGVRRIFGEPIQIRRTHKFPYFRWSCQLRETVLCQRIAHGSRSPKSKNKRRLEIHRIIYTKHFLIPIPRLDQPVKFQTVFILINAAGEPACKIFVGPAVPATGIVLREPSRNAPLQAVKPLSNFGYTRVYKEIRMYTTGLMPVEYPSCTPILYHSTRLAPLNCN